MHKNTGFTLIELMIVVAVVAILAAIAYPSYDESIKKSRRGECQGAMVSLAGAMERHNTINNGYTGAGAGGGNTGAPTIFSTKCPVDGNDTYYNLTINAATATTFTLNAAPVNAQANDKCGTLTLTHTGARNITGQDAGVASSDCWQ